MVTLKRIKTLHDMKGSLCFLVSLLLPSFLLSQALIRTDSVPVFQNSVQLKNAWAGGINNAQVSEIDLNGDAFTDLFVFDKSGDKIITFINDGINGVASYKHAPQYESMFPKMRDWALLRDFNCDGKQDIFTYNNGSVTVYKNTTVTAGQLTFEQYQKPVISDYGQYNLALYVSSIDIPAISDIDGDGDLDILTFSVAGMQVEFHRNMTKENFGHCDSLNYVLSDKCWGSFLESPSNCTANINQTCQHLKLENPSLKRNSDSGFSLLAFDSDNDGDQELLVSTANCTSMYLLTNTGTSQNAHIGSITNNYPPSAPVNISRFPAGYYLDLNNDNKKDLLVSPNVVNISENYRSMLFFENTGTAGNPDFTMIQNDFLQSGMMEFGESSNPVLFDYDGDGLKDLFVSSYGYFQNNNFKSQIAHYRNTGTSSSPVFQLVTRDFENLSSRSISNIHHSLGDVDKDGDVDLVIGDNAGRIQFFENTGSGFTMVPDLRDSAGTIIDVGSTAAPQLFDLNKDGWLDLIIGEQNGNLNYFRNTASGTAKFKNMRDSLGKVNVTQKGFFTGSSKPWFFTENNVTKLYVGSERGYVFAYDNIDNNLTGKFRLIDSIYQNINPGIKSSVTAADLNNDGMAEVIIGNKRGGLEFYRSAGFLDAREYVLKTFKLYPNPTNGVFNIETSDKIMEVKVYDMKGVLLLNKKDPGNTIDASFLSRGLYLLNCITDLGSFSSKLVIE